MRMKLTELTEASPLQVKIKNHIVKSTSMNVTNGVENG